MSNAAKLHHLYSNAAAAQAEAEHYQSRAEHWRAVDQRRRDAASMFWKARAARRLAAGYLKQAAELHQEFREDMKGIARKFLAATDISCDNIAAVCGLSKHTVRGMSTGTKNYKGLQERTEMNYTEIMEAVTW